MKKILLMMSLMLGVLVFTSCSNDEVVNEEVEVGNELKSIKLSPQDQASLMMLHSQIVDYNNNDYVTGNSQPRKAKWWKKFLKVVVTAFADATGYVAANVPGSLIASAVVGAYVARENVDVVIVPMNAKDNNPLKAPWKATLKPNIEQCLSDSIGFYHNVVMSDLFKSEEAINNIKSLSDIEIADLSVSRGQDLIPNTYNLDITEWQKENTLTIAQTIYSLLYESETFEEFCEKLNSTGVVDPAILLVLEEYMKGLENSGSEERQEKYYNDMIKLVKDAEMSPEIKEPLEGGFIIGNSSLNLWTEMTDDPSIEP